MDLLPFIVLGGLAILFVWGVLAPRSQWRALVSWTYRDPRADEPSTAAYIMHRIIASLGIVALTGGGLAAWQIHLNELPEGPEAPSAMMRMWGWENPVVLNRTVIVSGSPRADLVEQAVLGYQAVDGQRRQPPYLFGLKHFEEPDVDPSFIAGTPPSPGLVALDSAELVVFVSGDPACVPMEVVVQPRESSVTVAVYYGRPDATPPTDTETKGQGQGQGKNKNKGEGKNEGESESEVEGETESVAIDDCRPGLRNTQPVLIPISLTDPLGERTVVAFDGIPVRKAPVVAD